MEDETIVLSISHWGLFVKEESNYSTFAFAAHNFYNPDKKIVNSINFRPLTYQEAAA